MFYSYLKQTHTQHPWTIGHEREMKRKKHSKQWKKSKGVSGTDCGAGKRKTELDCSRLK